MRQQWKEEEIKYLIDNYKIKTNREISEVLGRTKTAIDVKANKLGLKSSKYYYNEKYFEKINTEEKAYWLGFIYADGYVVHSGIYGKEFGIELQAKDINHLKKFNKSVNGNLKINKFKKKCNLNNKTYDMCSIRIYRKNFVESLEKWGVIENKTFDIKFPNINEELIRHFIRGYFDGDGCVTKNKEYIKYDFTSGNISFLEELRCILYKNNIKSYIYKEKENTYRLCIGGMLNCDIFYNYLYKDSNIYLDRKFNKKNSIYDELNIDIRIEKYCKKYNINYI